MATSAHFQLLKRTTEVKLRELSKHERKLEAHYAALLADVAHPDHQQQLPAHTLRRQLDTLYEGVKDLQVVQTHVHSGLSGVDELVEFAAADPWTTRRVLQQHAERILREIDQKRALWRHNKLLGALLLEALDETDRAQKKAGGRSSGGDDAQPEPASDFAASGGDAGPLMGLTKEETQTRLESFFFAPAAVQEDDVHAFLATQVFHVRADASKEKTKRAQDALSVARASMRAFSESFLARTVDSEDVLACVAAMLRDKASFSDDIVQFLEDVKSNKDMQVELAHVLTIQLSNMREFKWPEEGVTVEIKRGMNGRFRCFLQEDALTALLFQYIGLSWSVQMKEVLTKLLDSVRDEAKFDPGSIDSSRSTMAKRFCLSALPDSFESAGGAYGEDNDDTAKKLSKQDIVRLVLTEAHLAHALGVADSSNKRSSTSLTAVTTDLEFFGPSVCHDAVFACLRFLGVEDPMLAIFRTYVGIPLVFPGYPSPKPMRRGLSVGRMMTTFLSELLLFVMDYKVLAENNLSLYRMHDDIWFFDADENKVLRAWHEMNRVAGVLGLKFNEEKSGSLRIDIGGDAGSSSPASSTDAPPGIALPSRSIKWGLLMLRSDGTVQIAKEEVTAFATEMADRLSAAGSVLAWINVYNKYMGFFQRNLGNASPVFGLSYVDAILETLKDIHLLVFPQTQGDVLASLNAKIAANHPEFVADSTPSLPAAWVHWSMELGGLGLVNAFLAVWSLKEPMFEHLQTHHSSTGTIWPKERKHWEWRRPFETSFQVDVKEPFDLFAESVEAKGVKWAKSANRQQQFMYLKTTKFTDAQRWDSNDKVAIDDSYSLRTFDEFLALVPRVRLGSVQSEFVALTGEVEAKDPELSTAAQREASTLLQAAGVSGSYWKWVAFIYGEQLLSEFGSVSFFSRELLPAQLIQAIKTTAVSW